MKYERKQLGCERYERAEIAAVGNKVNAGGLGYSGYGFLTSNEFAIVSGVIIAFAGLLVSWYYKRKDSRILLEFKKREHELLEKESASRVRYQELKTSHLEEEHTRTKKD
jgi:Bacteriophage holin family, superfamily II-like